MRQRPIREWTGLFYRLASRTSHFALRPFSSRPSRILEHSHHSPQMRGFFSQVKSQLTKEAHSSPSSRSSRQQSPPAALGHSLSQQQSLSQSQAAASTADGSGKLSHQPSQSSKQPQNASPPNNSNPNARPAYPWAARRLAITPIASLSRSDPPTPSPSPFPRYGHSLPPIASASGELFLFGGLVREQVKNDLYSFSTRDLSATLIETKGEIPPARVGHASALVSSVLIVWGGDTKTNDVEKQDEGLYLLNLGEL